MGGRAGGVSLFLCTAPCKEFCRLPAARGAYRSLSNAAARNSPPPAHAGRTDGQGRMELDCKTGFCPEKTRGREECIHIPWNSGASFSFFTVLSDGVLKRHMYPYARSIL